MYQFAGHEKEVLFGIVKIIIIVWDIDPEDKDGSGKTEREKDRDTMKLIIEAFLLFLETVT